MAKRWRPLDKYTSWRKIAMGFWDPPTDPTIYGFETLVMDDTLEYLERVSAVSGVKLTPTHLVVKCLADVFARHPEINVIVLGNRVLQRDHVDIFCQVAIPGNSAGEADLSGVKLSDVDQMDVVDVAKALRARASRVRRGEDEEIERQKTMVDRIPRFLIRRAMKAMDFLTFTVPVDLDALGIRSDPFGTAMVSSIAAFDLRLGFAPLVPVSRCAMLCLPGAVFEDAQVIDGEVKICKVMQISMTFDHRAVDGLQIGVLVREMREHLEHAADHFPAPEAYAHHHIGADPNEPPTPEERGPRR